MYEVIKKNKKLIIVDKYGNLVYSMPNWVRPNTRKDLEKLAEEFNEIGSDDIELIMKFETKFSRVNKNKGRLAQR